MARYIDAERLKMTFASGIRVYDGMCRTEDIFHNINNEPTADVVSVDACKQISKERDFAIKQLHSYGVQFGEKADVVKVKHGEWQRQKQGFYFVCSVCRKASATKGNYCHSCGAKMDGGKSE